jgi:hypothetical protein
MGVDETHDLHARKDNPLPIGWFALFTPSDAMPKDRGLYVKRRLLITAIAVIVCALCWGASQSATFVEGLYANWISQLIGRGLGTVTGWIPTSLAEICIVLLAGWLLFHWGRASYFVAVRKRRSLNALACGGLHLLALFSVIAAVFYLFWGINYARPPLIERDGWQRYDTTPADRDAQAEELAALCEALVEATNENYFMATGSEDYGGPSAPAALGAALDASIDEGYRALQKDLGQDASFGESRGRAKPVAFSMLMDHLQIGGFYFPWTGEANYNRNQPSCQIPFVIAHEKAHQRCIASEDEANFYGFAACIRADDPYVRYSGYLFAQRQLLFELGRLDRERMAELVKQRLPGVQRDVDDLRAYWQQFEGAVAEISHKVNDAYLSSHGVEGGILSYGYSAKLLVVYSRRQGGIIVKQGPEKP